jgi:hypothetical protein
LKAAIEELRGRKTRYVSFIWRNLQLFE